MKKNYGNATTYKRALHDADHIYLPLSYIFLNDNRLNAVELGIMVMILKQSNYFVLNTTYLQTQCGVGKDRFYKAITNLQKYGYLEKINRQGSTHWIINEISFTTPVFTTTESTTPENTPLITTN